jgi:hypothetical protein
MRHSLTITVFAVAALAGVLAMNLPLSGQMEMPFGGKDDVAFANALWIGMKGYDGWRMKSDFYPGKSPHGKILRMYDNIVTVEGKPYNVIVKDNFGGEGATLESVAKDPTKYLMAVTAMVQREPGYDPEDNNWFYAKYPPDGTIDKNEKGMALAGRVAKGMDTGCIACHRNAGGNDFIFSNDK